MTSIATSSVDALLDSMYEQRQEMVPCLIGPPGIGKTQGIQAFARSKGAKVVTFILSTALPSEVSGIRMPDVDTKSLEVFDDSRMASLKDGDVLFFDEILEAPPALWSACLTLIQDRMLASGRKLPDVFIVAASNPLANCARIPASFRDRFQFVELEWDAYAWFEYIRSEGLTESKYGNPDAEVLVDDIRRGIREPELYGYNIFSPRRATKLMRWLHDAEDKETVKSFIGSMFTQRIAADLFDVVTYHDVDKEIKEDTDAALELVRDNIAKMVGIEIDPEEFDLDNLAKIIEGIEDEEKKVEVMEYLGKFDIA